MRKRIAALLLALVLLLGTLPIEAKAAEAKMVTLRVWQGDYRQVLAMEYQDMLYFSPSDLGWMTGFTVTYIGDDVIFTRGSKSLRVATDEQTMYINCAGKELEREVWVGAYDNTWYLEGHKMLAWMNTACDATVDGWGVLYCVPNASSVWDLRDSFNIDDHTFDFEGCCEMIGVSRKKTETSAYFKENGIKCLLDIDLNGNGKTHLGKERYYKMFEDLFRDQSASDAAMGQWADDCALAKSAADIGELLLPEYSDVLGFFGDVLDVGETTLDYYIYCSLFQEDNSQKLAMMDALLYNVNYRDNKNMLEAAQEIKDSYTDFWSGVYEKAKYDIVDKVVEGLTSKGVLKLLNIDWDLGTGVNEKVDRIGSFDQLAATGRRIYKAGFGDCTMEEIQDALCGAMLCLYSVEQNYDAIMAYSYDSRHGNVNASRQFVAAEEAADAAYGQLLSTALYLEYDACDKDIKREQVAQLKEIIGKVKYREMLDSVDWTIEQAMLISALQANGFGEFGLDWMQNDIDGDGTKELLYAYYVTDAMYDRRGIVVDPDSMMHEELDYMQGTGVGDFVWSADRSKIYGHYGYNYSPAEAWGIKEWTGTEWQELLDYQTDGAAYNWRVNGKVATQAEHEAAAAQYPLGGFVEFDSPDLSDFTLKGDTKTLYSQAKAYLDSHPNRFSDQSADFDGDGDTDYAKLIFGALRPWSVEGCDDSYMTVVVLMPESDGIRVRTCTLPEHGSYLTGVEDRDITVGDLLVAYYAEGDMISFNTYAYHYRESGPVFSSSEFTVNAESAGTPAGNIEDLLNCNFADCAAMIPDLARDTDYPQFSYGTLDGAEFSISFPEAALDTAAPEQVYVYPNGSSIEICEGVHTGMTQIEIWGQIPSTNGWSELYEDIGPMGESLGWATSFGYVHPESGREYSVIITFDSDDTLASVTGVQFIAAH